MKPTLIILILLLTALIAWAATLTIDIPAADVPRVSEAYGSILGLGRNATSAEVQEAVQLWIINSTLDYERRRNTYNYSPTPTQMQPTPIPSPTPTPTPTPTP